MITIHWLCLKHEIVCQELANETVSGTVFEKILSVQNQQEQLLYIVYDLLAPLTFCCGSRFGPWCSAHLLFHTINYITVMKNKGHSV